ncbi:MAG: hypothetical protein ACI8UO_003747 [Verrucomicrobiales bacterium]|jgi:hypothetical protein
MAARPSHPESRLIRTLSISTVSLVLLLGAGAFAVSFHALQGLAADNGFDGNSFILPLILDGGIIVFSLSALRFELSGVSSRYPMSLVIVTTVASILFNVVHAEPTMIARGLSAMPPLILFLSFELLMKQVRLEAGMVVAPKSQTKRVKVSHPATPRVDERRQRVENLRSQDLGPRQIAQRLGVSVQTVYRDLGQLRKAEA